MGLFAVCPQCGKKKLAFQIQSSGLCNACAEAKRVVDEKRTAEEQAAARYRAAQDALERQRMTAAIAEMQRVNEELREAAQKGGSSSDAQTHRPIHTSLGVTATGSSPDDTYVFLDVETTGLNPHIDSIIQISALRYEHQALVNSYDTYINPQCVIPFSAYQVHGISDEMVREAPTIDQVKDSFLQFIAGATLAGYNVAFDIRFLSAAFGDSFRTMQCVDVMEMAKKSLTLPNYRLGTVADAVGFRDEGSFHNALYDCKATAAVFFALGGRPQLPHSYSHDTTRMRSAHRESFRPKDISPSAEAALDPSHPLFGKIVVFTGDMSISRNEAAQMAVDAGATVRTSVSGKTDYLVVGQQDMSIVGEDGMSSKEEKAHALNAEGKAHITFLSERDYLGLFERASHFDPYDKRVDGLTFVLTGVMERPRDELLVLIEQHGGRASGSVSRKTDYVVAGENAGEKLRKAEELNIPIITEDQLLEMLGLGMEAASYE